MREISEKELLDALLSGGDNFRFGETERQKILNSPNLKEKLATLRESGEEIRGQEILEMPYTAYRRFFTDGDRTEYEHADHGYFVRRRRLATYAFLYWLDRKPEDLDELCNAIWAILNEYTWSLPAHIHRPWTEDEDEFYTLDLFASETGEALSETLSLVGEDLPALIVNRIRREVDERIFQSYSRLTGWWKTGSNNWVAVCSGSVGMAAMLMIDDKKRLAEDFIRPILKSMEGFLSGFSDDGVCLEGIGYWHYGFGYFTAFADMLDRYTGGKIDLFRDAKVRKIAGFLEKTVFKGGNCVPFADAGGRGAYTMNTLGVFLRKYPETVVPMRKYINLPFEKQGCFRFALLLRELVEGAVDTVWDNETEPTGTHLLTGAEWFIRSGENGVTLAAKGGHNDEPHNHNDVGGFALFGLNGGLIEDLGSGLYCKDYFSKPRYTFIETSSRGHSVPIVNGNFQSAGKEFRARDVKMTENEFSLDIAGAYEDEKIHTLTRQFTVVDENTFTLTDTFEFTEDGCSATERFVTRKEVNVKNGLVTVSNGKQLLTISNKNGAVPTVSVEKQSRAGQTVYLIDYPVSVCAKQAEEAFMFTIKNK